MYMDIESALEIEAAEREYLHARVENLLRLDGNPYGARVFLNGALPCFQVAASPSPMLNRIYGEPLADPQAMLDLLKHNVSVTPLIGSPSTLEPLIVIAGCQLERLKGWTHVQLACALEQTVINPHSFNIEEATTQTLDAFTEVHAGGFHTKPAQRALNQASFSGAAAGDSLKVYVIKEAGEVVAGAVMFLASNGIAYLGTAATRKADRGRGYHGALIAHRIEQARKLGCRAVAATALANSQSRRNLQRAGLKISHTQALYRLLNG
ncbi:hypothetical protein PS3A_35530 [Pseudomonas sp. 3A(2025)]